MIKVTNPDIYSSTFARKFNEVKETQKTIFNKGKQIPYKLKQKNKQQISVKRMN